MHLIALAAVSLALFAAALRNDFVTDDTLQIQENKFITSYLYIPKLFTTNVWEFLHASISNYYRPLQMLFYMGEYYSFGWQPWLWHLVNLLLHVGAVVAAYVLIRALADESLAFWVAMLFALHPIHVETVVWIAAVPDLLCALCLFTGTYFYHRARNGTLPRLSHGIAATIFFAGLFSKETTLVFPALLLAYEFFYRRESLRKVALGLRRLLPYFCAAAVYLAVRVRVLGAFAPGFIREQHHSPFTVSQVLLSVPVLLRQYIFKLLLPVNLNYYYHFTPQNRLDWNVIASVALIAGLLFCVWWLRKVQPLLAFALSWFFLTLAPVLSISSVGENVFTERYLYVPSLGFCILVAWAWLRLRERATEGPARTVAYSCLAVVVILYCVQIVRRIPDWRTDLQLFRKTALQSPNSATVQASLGVAYYQAGQLDLAVAPLERSLELRPKSYLSHLYLALTLSAMGESDRANAHLLRAHELKPESDTPWSLFGQAHSNLHQWDRAIDCFRRALTNEPQNPVLFTVLGEALEHKGDIPASISAYREALRLQPGSLDASINLTITLAEQGDTDEAIRLLVYALKAHPAGLHADAGWVNLGAMYARRGAWDDAEAAYRHALELNPTSVVAQQQLEFLEAQRRK